MSVTAVSGIFVTQRNDNQESQLNERSTNPAATAIRVASLFGAFTLTVAGGSWVYSTTSSCFFLNSEGMCLLELLGGACVTVSGIVLSGIILTELVHPSQHL